MRDLARCVIAGPNVNELDPSPGTYDFKKADLSFAKLSFGDFRSCDFQDARIDCIQMAGCIVDFERLAASQNFRRRVLVEAHFGNVRFSGKCDFSRMDLRGTEFHDITDPGALPLSDLDFTDAIISRCIFVRSITKEHLCSTRSFKNGDLTGCTFHFIDFSGCDFHRVNLTRCRFSQCNFTGASFEDSVITGVRLSQGRFGECTGLTAEQIQSTWNYKRDRMKGIILPPQLASARAAAAVR
jgi:uncharacterized protein YjbI with pentapeptide repeats